jgi:hypothetical protein
MIDSPTVLDLVLLWLPACDTEQMQQLGQLSPTPACMIKGH